MLLNEKYLPKLKDVPDEWKEEYKSGDIGKKKYIWTRVLMSRLEGIPKQKWMNKKDYETKWPFWWLNGKEKKNPDSTPQSGSTEGVIGRYTSFLKRNLRKLRDQRKK